MSKGLHTKRIITDNEGFKKVVDIESSRKIGLPNGFVIARDLKQIQPGNFFEIKGKRYYVLSCDLYEYVMSKLKRRTQIIYPKDIGYILIKLDISPGKRIGEAGTGSGALTIFFSRAVGKEGRVYTYEKRKDFIELIQRNLAGGREFENVVLYNRAVEEGIHEKELDAFFLDLKEPWEVLDIVAEALKPDGYLGVLVPTTNQISQTLKTLENLNFLISEVVEIMIREYKLNADRFRPNDIMVGHTGYLIFARKLEG